MRVIIIKMKICKYCQRELPLKCFNKNKNNKDHLSYYCKECTKEKKNLYFYNQGNEFYERVIIDELKKYSDISINGLDYDKVYSLTFSLYDFPVTSSFFVR